MSKIATASALVLKMNVPRRDDQKELNAESRSFSLFIHMSINPLTRCLMVKAFVSRLGARNILVLIYLRFAKIFSASFFFLLKINSIVLKLSLISKYSAFLTV